MEKKTEEQTRVGKSIYAFFKLLIDKVLGLIGTLILIPLAALVKLFYMLSGDFENIFFKHTRIGKDGKQFGVLKFRTMVPNAQDLLNDLLKDPKVKAEWEENHKLDKDPRITKIGKILRKTSLDEFPQFINLLVGQMSFIGPRPLVTDEINKIGDKASEYLSVRPGITGYWACNGRSNISFKERIEMELYYVGHSTLLMDSKILVKTVLKVLKSEGAK